MKTSNKMLIVSVINILWFTIVAIILQFVCQVELSSTLINCWYIFWTAEIFTLAGIKVSKVKHQTDAVFGDELPIIEEESEEEE